MGTSPIGISGKWTPPGFTTPRLCPPSSSGFIPPSSLKSVPSAPFVPSPSPRHPGTLFPTVGALSPLRARFFPPWGRFFRSVRAFSHRGGAFSVPCVLFPAVGALFPFRARFFPPRGRFFRPVRAFSHRGGAFSVPCALFPIRARFFRSVRAFSPPCALSPIWAEIATDLITPSQITHPSSPLSFHPIPAFLPSLFPISPPPTPIA
jgi:hypothetical protein